LRWLGHDEKCFRFEILGCEIGENSNFAPELDFNAESLAAGFLSSGWLQHPEVVVPGNEVLSLDVPYFIVNVTSYNRKSRAWEDQEIFNTTDNVLILGKPIWGGDYRFKITCAFQGLELDCGEHDAKAIVETNSACFKHDPECPIADHVVFAMPQNLTAISLINGSTLVTWSEDPRGWTSPKMLLQVLDVQERSVVSASSDWQSHTDLRSIVVPKLNGETLTMTFIPEGEGVPGETEGLSASLALSKFLSFIVKGVRAIPRFLLK
jgi:hypothetical protein